MSLLEEVLAALPVVQASGGMRIAVRRGDESVRIDLGVLTQAPETDDQPNEKPVVTARDRALHYMMTRSLPKEDVPQ